MRGRSYQITRPGKEKLNTPAQELMALQTANGPAPSQFDSCVHCSYKVNNVSGIGEINKLHLSSILPHEGVNKHLYTLTRWFDVSVL